MDSQPKPTLRSVLPWLVAIAFFIETLDATILNTAAPRVAESLGVEPLSLKAALTSYALSLAVFIPISGWVADRLGTRRTFTSAMALFALGSLLCGLSVNLPMMVASRILQGAGGSLMIPVGRIAMVRTYPRSELIRALNFVIIPGLLGPLLGPLAGGLIVQWLPWHFIFWVNLPFCFAGVLASSKHMPDYRSETSPPLDWVGFLLFGSGVGLLAFALEVLGEHTLPMATVALIAALGVGLVVTYVITARTKEHPLLALDLFKVRTFRISVVGGFVTRLGIAGMPFLLPLLYQIGLGFPPWKAGLLMMPAPAAAILMKFLTGPILKRIGHRVALRWNTVLLGGVIASYSLIEPGRPIALIVGLAFLHGFLMSLQFTSVNSLAYADVPNERTSGASSITSTGQQMSMSFGIALASFLAILLLGGLEQAEPQAFAAGLHRTFWILGGFTVISSLTFIGLRADDGNNVSNRANRIREPATNVEEATLRTRSR
ncbi:MAG: DHA2 family efflux MFS transporter permease subunit [Verrucomicrobiota bacterium JB022]|nr:DHA2 family efflux MFS transporter permease subunit [Verrucomicrobiota bacterium JB022]